MPPKLPVEIHPIADIFPMMAADEFEGLKKDIVEFGVREPMTMWNNKLIDGRNRMAACVELKIDWESHLCELDSDQDPVTWILSHNLHRRHLSQSQKSLVAARIRDYYDDAAKDRQKLSEGRGKKGVEKLPPVKSRDAAGAAVGVSGKLVDAATTVLEHGSKELVAKVESGDVSVTKAAKVAREVPKQEQVKAIESPQPKPERTVFTRLRQLFDDMTPSERKSAAVMWEDWLDS